MTVVRPRVLAFAFAMILSALAFACGSGSSDDPNDYERKVVPAPIDGLEILVRESSPPGYTAHITSGLPSGCARFDEAVISSREGDTITIAVTNTVPDDDMVACDASYGFHETNLDLGQDFDSGKTYTVRVNDKETTFVAQ
jgi:hypothetical protein